MPSAPVPEWRGERRSARLGGNDFQLDDEVQHLLEDPATLQAKKKRRIMSPDAEEQVTSGTAHNIGTLLSRIPKNASAPGDRASPDDTPSLESDRPEKDGDVGSDSSSLSSIPSDSDDDDFF